MRRPVNWTRVSVSWKKTSKTRTATLIPILQKLIKSWKRRKRKANPTNTNEKRGERASPKVRPDDRVTNTRTVTGPGNRAVADTGHVIGALLVNDDTQITGVRGTSVITHPAGKGVDPGTGDIKFMFSNSCQVMNHSFD
jgi:hypothetical protein